MLASPSEFLDTFRRLDSFEPYRWQQRLLIDWFRLGRIPTAIDIPTGLGKTKVMTAWLCARMLGAALPRRLVYVVDRRAVVDQATREAEEISTRLHALLCNSKIGSDVRAEHRRRLGLTDGEGLPISTLRGQYADNRRWMDNPYGAAIVVGTVDMIGSRLLFSGYGIGPGMRPAHAGFLGADTLVVLDEAHLVPAFEELTRQVAALTDEDRRRSGGKVPSLSLVTLSATARGRAGGEAFALADDDESDPPVAARLSAPKRLALLDQVTTSELSSALAECAWKRGTGGRRVIIFSNSRKVAQDVESDLRERVKRAFGMDATLTGLLVGERRLYERTLEYDPPQGHAGASIFERFKPDAPPSDMPAFLVATSAGEVGIDLDADDLVCDLVPWERMVQRFGRVNRRATPTVAFIDVIPSLSEKDAENAVMAERLEQLRAPFASVMWPADNDGFRDASPGRLRRIKAAIGPILDTASTPAPFMPKLDRPTVQAWAMTSLREHSGRPAIAPYLRGWSEDRPQSTIVWRRLFPLAAQSGQSLQSGFPIKEIISEFDAFFDSAPPNVNETLDAPADRIADIVRKRVDAYEALTDAQRSMLDDEREPAPRHPPILVILDSRYDVEQVLDIPGFRKAFRNAEQFARALVDRTLVLDARFAGLSEAGLLDAKASELPPTIDGPIWELTSERYAQRRIRWGALSPPSSESAWRYEGYRWVAEPERDESNVLWVEVLRSGGANAGDPAVSRTAQILPEHHAWTREEALRIADGLGFSEADTLLLATAAFAHDAGKARDLWQNAMNANSEGRPYAKTTGGAAPRTLSGYRHEFGSLGDIIDDAAFLALPEGDRELALHLVAAHHGHTRPVVRAIDPDRAPSRSAELACLAALRYEELSRLWGPWGLAWWEAVLRSADWAASARVNRDA
jgi:CRISPR-associated endonuclease/helicase Cas3